MVRKGRLAESVSMSLVLIMSTLFDLAQLERLSLPGSCLLGSRPSALGCLHPCAVPSSVGLRKISLFKSWHRSSSPHRRQRGKDNLRRRHC